MLLLLLICPGLRSVTHGVWLPTCHAVWVSSPHHRVCISCVCVVPLSRAPQCLPCLEGIAAQHQAGQPVYCRGCLVGGQQQSGQQVPMEGTGELRGSPVLREVGVL